MRNQSFIVPVVGEFVVVVVVHPTDYTCEHLGHELLDQIRLNTTKPEPGPIPAPLFNQSVPHEYLIYEHLTYFKHLTYKH